MKATIMIVDDSPYIVDGLSALLRRRGYEPVVAHDGDECLRMLPVVRPDLILLDIMMEPRDGWETLEEIRSGSPDTNDIPVLMFSAKKITPDEASGHSMSMDDFIAKPINPDELLGAIGRVFARRRELDEWVAHAKDAGLDQAIISEYVRLRRSIEADGKMLAELRMAIGMDIPGKSVSDRDRDAIARLEEKVRKDGARLREING